MGGVSRRSAIRAAVLAAAAVGAAALPSSPVVRRATADDIFGGRSPLLFHSPPLQPFRDELPRLPIVGGVEVSLEAHSAVHSFHVDLAPGPTFSYGGVDYLGPTIESVQGQPWTLLYANRTEGNPLAADVDTSLHGMSEHDRHLTPTSLHRAARKDHESRRQHEYQVQRYCPPR